MMATNILQDQLELYQKYAGEEPPQTVPVASAFRHQIEDAVALGLTLVRQIRRRNREMAERRQLTSDVFTREESAYLTGLYRGWLDGSTSVLNTVDFLKSQGYDLEGADEMRRHHREVSLMGFDYDRAVATVEALKNEQFKPLREAADEFRHRRYGSGA